MPVLVANSIIRVTNTIQTHQKKHARGKGPSLTPSVFIQKEQNSHSFASDIESLASSEEGVEMMASHVRCKERVKRDIEP